MRSREFPKLSLRRLPAPVKLVAMVAFAAMVATLVVPSLASAPPAEAQVFNAFAPRFQTNAKGDIDFIANTTMTCPATDAGCAAAQGGNGSANNSFNMVYVDVDADASTFNSSSSTLNLPAGANVLWAGLYWGSRSNAATRNVVQLEAGPGTGYAPVTAAVVQGTGALYQGVSDITSIVQAAGNTTYTVANVEGTPGGGQHGGWSIVVAYEDTSLPFRNLTVFDGFAQVNSANPVSVTVSGFLTPVTGPVTAKLTTIAYEGDEGFTGDQLLFEGNVLSDATHPATNFFNSRISKDGALFTDKNPDYVDQLGYDSSRIDVTGLLGNSQNSATLEFSSAGDWYYPGLAATAIDIFVPDLDADLSKTFVDLNGGTVLPGDVIEYVIKTTNTGQDPSVDTVLTDAIPAGTTYVAGSLEIIDDPGALSGTTPDDAMGNIATDGGGFDGTQVEFQLGANDSATYPDPGGRIPIGDSFEVRFQVTVDAGTEFQTIPNEASLDYKGETVGTDFEVTGDAEFTVASESDLVLVSKVDSADPVTAGQTFDYTVTVRNDGPSPAINAVVNDPLPAGLSFASGTGCSDTSGTVTCALPTPLAVGATASVTFTVLVDPAAGTGTLVNKVNTSSDTPEGDATNNTGSETTEIVRNADLKIVKTASPDPQVNAGSQITYTLTVTNDGPSTAVNTNVVDTLPTGVTLVSSVPSVGTCAGSAPISCALGAMAPGAVETITVVVDVASNTAAGTVLVNNTKVGSDTPDDDSTNDTSGVKTEVVRDVGLTLTKTDLVDPVNAGGSVTYALTAGNTGPSDASSVVITDTLPAPLVFDPANSSAGCVLTTPPNVVTCTIGTLVDGGTASVTISATVPSSATPQTVTNTAVVTATEDATGATATEDTTIDRLINLSVGKSDVVDPVAAGTNLTWNVTIGNSGPSDASGVALTDTLPAAVTFVSGSFPSGLGSCSHDGSATGGVVTCIPTGGVLVNGATDTVQIVVSVPAGLPDGTVLTNNATLTASEDPTGVSDDETTNVENVVALSIGKTASPDPVVAGEQLTYTVNFSNAGPSVATAAQFVDSLPVGVVYDSFSITSAGGGTCSHDGSAAGGDVTCSPAGGTLGAGELITVEIVVTVDSGVADGASIVNNVTGSATGADDVTAEATTSVKREADMGVAKSAAPDPATAGSTLTYTLDITNYGPSDATGVASLDALPSGVTIQTPLPTGCTDVSGTITCSVGTMAAGDMAQLVFTVLLDANLPPGTASLTNIASVTANEPDPNPDNDGDRATVDVITVVDLGITKVDVSDPVVAGGTIYYTIDVTNAGPSDANNVTITDPVPSALLTFNAGLSSSGCSLTPTPITCSVGTIVPNGSASVVIAFDVDPATPDNTVFTNTATVTSDEDPVGASGSEDTTIETEADLSVLKVGTGVAVPGSSFTWSIDVANSGPSDAVNATLTDALPAGVTFQAANVVGAGGGATCVHDGVNPGGTVSCTFGTMAPDDSLTVEITVLIAASATGSLSNTAVVDSDTTDPDDDNNSSTDLTSVIPRADLSLTKTASPDPVIAGQQVTYVLTVTNNGPADAADATVVDALPTSSVFSAATVLSGAGTCGHDGAAAGGDVTCTFGPIANGASVQMQIVVTVDGDTTSSSMTNDAGVSSTTEDPDPTNNDDTAPVDITTLADLTIVKTDSPDPVLAGSNVTFTLSVTNNGPSTAQSVTVSDPLSGDLTFVSWAPVLGLSSCSHSGGNPGGTLFCSLGSVPVGATVVFSFDAEVAPGAAGPVTNTATVSSPTDPTDGTSDTSTNVESSADLVFVAKTASVDPVTAGGSMTYQLTVRNDGPSDAVNVVITDPLPAGLTFDPVTSTPGCAVTSGVVSCPVGTVVDGATATVTIGVDIDPAQVDQIQNTARVDSDTPDPDGTNNDADEDTNVERDAEVRITKVASPDPVVAGEPVTWTITVVNDGPSTATNVVITDPIPLGMTFSSASASAGSCLEAGGLVTCAVGSLAVNGSATATIVVDTDSDLAAGATLTNTASANWEEGGPIDASDSVAVEREADLAITKTDLADPVPAGGTIMWQLAVANLGPSDATSIVITDAMPTWVTFNSGSSSSGCTLSGTTVTCLIASLAATTTTSVIIAGDLDPQTPVGTSIYNEAAVSADEDDPDDSNNEGDETTEVSKVADLALVKTDLIDPVAAGENAEWQLVVTNNGPSDTGNIVVQDVLPAGATFVSGVGSVGVSCSDAPPGAAGATVTCVVPYLAADASSMIVVTASIDPGLPDGSVITNNAAIADQDGTDPNPDNDEDDEDTEVNREPGLILMKKATSSAAVAGEPFSWTLTLSNTGSSVASGVTIVDSLPATTTFVSAGVTGGTETAACAELAGVVSCDVGAAADFELNPGDDVEITVTVLVDADLTTTDTLVNTATADSNETDPTEATEETPVTRSADIALVKTASPDPVVAGEPLTYTLTVTNNGPSDASNVVVGDVLPTQLSLVSLPAPTALVTCSSALPSVSCTVLTLAVGQSVAIDVETLVDSSIASGSTITNNASASADEDDPDNTNNDDSTDTAVDREADLQVAKTSTGNAVAGAPFVWTITAVNDGPSAADNVTITDPLPAGVTFDAATSTAGCTVSGGVVTCLIGSMADGATTALQIGVVVDADLPAGSDITNAATVDSDEPDPDPDNTDTDSPEVVESADLLITKTGSAATAVAGQPFTWLLAVSNAGPSDADAVTVTDTLPAGLVPTSLSPECTGAGTVTCSVATLAAGDTVVFQIEVLVPASGLSGMVNVADVTSTTPDPDPDNNTDEETTPVGVVADLSITKTSVPDPLVAGGPITYTIVVTNDGPSDVVGALVEDSLPAGVGEPVWSCGVDGAGLCVDNSAHPDLEFLVDLAVGESATITIDATIDAQQLGDLTNVATVRPPDGVTDPDPSDNEAADINPSQGQADLAITKVADESIITNGGPVGWTILVQNLGPSAVSAATVSDTLPFGIANPTWTCVVTVGIGNCGTTAGTGNIAMSIDLDPASVITIDLVGTAQLPIGGALVNTASVTNPPGIDDPDDSNNEDSSTVGVLPAPTPTPTPTATAAPTSTPTPTPVSPSATPTATEVPTAVPNPTATPTVAATATAEPTATPEPSATAEPPATATPDPTATPEPTATTEPTATAIAGATVEPTPTATPTSTAAPTATAQPTATATSTAEPAAPTATASPTATAVASTLTPTATVAPTASAIPTAEPAPTSTGTPVPATSTPGPTPSATPTLVPDAAPTPIPADLTLAKVPPTGPLAPGDQVTWRILVTNTGTVSVDGASVLDQLPGNVFGASWECGPVVGQPQCLTASGIGDVDVLINIDPGEEIHVLVTATLDGTSPDLINTASVELPPGLIDANLAGNTDTTTSPIIILPQTIAQTPTATPVPAAPVATSAPVIATTTPLPTPEQTPIPTVIQVPLDIVDVTPPPSQTDNPPPANLAFSGRTIASTVALALSLMLVGWILVASRRRVRKD